MLRKLGVFCFMSLFAISYLYADTEPSGDKQSRPVFTISGQVIDSATLAPIVGAEVVVKANDGVLKVLTDDLGDYTINLYSLAWFRFCRIGVSVEGYYENQPQLVFLRPGTTALTMGFSLKDKIKPYLEIIAPSEGSRIFPVATIEINYNDRGSGVDKETVKIYANGRDLGGYIVEISDISATCVIPAVNPLGLGSCIISAEIKDLAGNLSREEVSVTVVSESDEYVELGKQALSSQDILTAHRYFSQAIGIDPNNAEANFYYAIIRLLVLPQKNTGIFDLFCDMGFTGPEGASLSPTDFDPFAFSAQPPAGFEEFDLAETFPDGESLQNIIRDKIISELDGSLKNLDVVLSSGGFSSYLEMSSPFATVEIIEIDDGDVGILKSLIYLIKAKMHEILVYNIDADLAEVSNSFVQGTLNPRYILEDYPELLRVKKQNLPHSREAKEAFISAINSYLEGYSFIVSETDPQYDDFLSIAYAIEYQEEAEFFAEQVRDIEKSLSSLPDPEFTMKLSQIVDSGYLFDNPFDFRKMLDMDGTSNFLSKYLIFEIDYALTNLSKADASYQEYLPPDNPFTEEQKDVDFADVSATKTGLESIRAVVLSMLAYDLNLDSEEILLRYLEGESININEILAYHPGFLRLMDTDSIDLAREAFGSMVEGYLDTVDHLRLSNNFDQSDDLLVPTDYFWQQEHRYTRMLVELDSMRPTEIDPETEVVGDEFTLNLGRFFIDYIDRRDLREFLPQFDEDSHVIPGSWPDSTFGGIFLDGVTGK